MRGSVVDIAGVTVGHAQDRRARTGCTVVTFGTSGAVCGVDVRGSAPGTRETDALAPTSHVAVVHAILLAGGSAFGLDAAGGVMAELEKRGIGFAVGAWRIPIVPAAILFDLQDGDGTTRPDRTMGARALRAASRRAPAQGRVGAGTGALVAKLGGIERARFGGVGSAATHHGELVVAALAVCNAMGSVYDPRTGEPIATPRQNGSPFDERAALATEAAATGATHTTLAVVATNARLSKVNATKVAQMAHDGLARAVRPAHLTRDGDTIFACALGEIEAPLDLVGVMAAEAVADAIARGVRLANAT